MKLLATMILMLAMVGCSESTTDARPTPSQPDTTADSSGPATDDTDTTQQDPVSPTTPPSVPSPSPAPAPAPTPDEPVVPAPAPPTVPSPAPEPPGVPADPVVQPVQPPDEAYFYQGHSLGYAPVKHGFDFLPDPRNLITVRSIGRQLSTREFKALVDAMHTVNSFRPFEAITTVDTTSINDIKAMCKEDGGRFSIQRCEYYAQSAYDKSLAGQDWEGNYPNGFALACWQSSDLCFYTLNAFFEGHSLGPHDFRLLGPGTHEASPIVAWHFSESQLEIGNINLAIFEHAECTGIDPISTVISESNGRFVSVWPGEFYTVWLLNQDAKADIARETAARSPTRLNCNAAMTSAVMK